MAKKKSTGSKNSFQLNQYAINRGRETVSSDTSRTMAGFVGAENASRGRDWVGMDYPGYTDSERKRMQDSLNAATVARTSQGSRVILNTSPNTKTHRNGDGTLSMSETMTELLRERAKGRNWRGEKVRGGRRLAAG